MRNIPTARAFAPTIRCAGRAGRYSSLAAVAAAVLASASPAIAPPLLPDANPAIWVVSDRDTVIFLFGTFHALDGRSDWFNDEVKTAFDSSGELILEALLPEDPARMRPLLAKHFIAPNAGPPVAGMPVFAERGPSFLGATRQVMAAGRSAGMSADKGADAILRRAAVQSGKKVGGLESVEFQLGMMGRMPGGPPGATPSGATNHEITIALRQMQAAWNAGDSESFAPILDAMQARSPESYRTLFADRNTRWATWIAARLATPGTVFVAVGSGHLAGRDSVQRKLAAHGIRSARL